MRAANAPFASRSWDGVGLTTRFLPLLFFVREKRSGMTAWIPAFAGMTGNSNVNMDSSFRWNDGDEKSGRSRFSRNEHVECDRYSARAASTTFSTVKPKYG